VTQQNKLIGVALALAVAVQFCQGAFSIVWIALHPRKSHNHLTVRVQTYRFPVESIPEIDLDPFKFCVYGRFKIGFLMYYNLMTLFGTSSPPASSIVSLREF
jgi:hypothetical protein